MHIILKEIHILRFTITRLESLFSLQTSVQSLDHCVHPDAIDRHCAVWNRGGESFFLLQLHDITARHVFTDVILARSLNQCVPVMMPGVWGGVTF